MALVGIGICPLNVWPRDEEFTSANNILGWGETCLGGGGYDV